MVFCPAWSATFNRQVECSIPSASTNIFKNLRFGHQVDVGVLWVLSVANGGKLRSALRYFPLESSHSFRDLSDCELPAKAPRIFPARNI